MATKSIDERYEEFVKDAQELLDRAGLVNPGQKPVIVGRGLLDAFNNLATIHFPEDTEVNGNGPRGMIWDMWGAFERKSDSVSGALALAEVVKLIIRHRPPLDIQERKARSGSKTEMTAIIKQCPFFQDSRRYELQEGLVFVLMPFRENWSDRLWNDHIRPYLEDVPSVGKLFVRRADDMFGQGVMEDVFHGIASAGLIIAECTGRNPNVLYELGIAHALGKRTALLSQSEADIPFDLRRFRFCVYEDNSSGYPRMKSFVQETAREVFGTKK